jgi:hypothetical protein
MSNGWLMSALPPKAARLSVMTASFRSLQLIRMGRFFGLNFLK